MRISLGGMIRRGFLLRNGRNWRTEVLYLEDDTVRGWRKIYDQRGIAGPCCSWTRFIQRMRCGRLAAHRHFSRISVKFEPLKALATYGDSYY